MNEIVMECMYDEDCSYITDRTLMPELAFSDIDDHLQEEHDTTLEDVIERLEEETGKSFEEIIRAGGLDEEGE